MKILYIVPYTPTNIRTRPYNLLRNLARLGHQVSLATVWENEAEHQWLERFAAEGIVVLSAPLAKPQIIYNIASALYYRKPLQSYYSFQPILANKIANITNDLHRYCDIIHIEHLRGAIYGLQRKHEMTRLPAKAPVVWDSVDNITALFEQAARYRQHSFGRLVARFELPTTRQFEIKSVSLFDRTLVTSPVDKDAFEKIVSSDTQRSKIEILTNGVDFDSFFPTDSNRQPDTIVFSGKLSYHANVAAALFLIQQVMPLVWEKRPPARLQLVGKDPHPDLVEISKKDQRVQVTGAVPELQPYLQKATIAAATLVYGAGVQNKVLEAMACATPVVATSIAVSALQATAGRDVLVADEPAELASTILDLLENAEMRRKVSENGLAYVRRHHNWNDIARNLVSKYENVIANTAELPAVG